MNSNLSNWLSNVKSDDIDGGLAADFDGSLSGLGVELGANTYNMSEALLALPSVYKQENNRNAGNFLLHHDSPSTPVLYSISNGTISDSPMTSRSLTLPLLRTVSFPSVELVTSSPHSTSLPSLSDSQNLTGDMDGTLVDPDSINTEWVSLMTSMKLGEVEDYSCKPRFQYILNASTSPATRMSEETLTYLNQGQPYEITLKQQKDGAHADLPLLKSVVRVVFHEKKLQSTEQQQLDIWRSTRPGERILDVDVVPSHGITDVKVDPLQLNSVEFVWDPNSMETTSVFVKVNCVSSEFTAKKHGGEKGVPFRIRIETYSNNLDEDNVLLHYASCQIKVFKPKGADRKNKTDKEKIEKQAESEKGKFQPAFNCTVLTETKEQSLTNHIIPSGTLSCLAKSPGSIAVPLTLASLDASSVTTCSSTQSSTARQVLHPSTFEDGPSNNDDTPSKKPPKSSTISVNQVCSTSSGTVSRKRPLETCSYLCSPHSPPTFNEDTLLSASTPDEVTRWLLSNRFHDFVETFSNFSGSDLLRLRREDLIQICGIANGIRLHNTLLAKSVQPRLTLYVCQGTNWPISDPILASSDVQHSPESSKSRSSTSSPVPVSHNSQATQPPSLSSQQRQQESNLPTDDSANNFLNGDVPNFNDLNFIMPLSCKESFKVTEDSQEQPSKAQFSFLGFNFSSSASSVKASKTRAKMSHFSPETRKKFDFKFTSSGEQVAKSALEPTEKSKELLEEAQMQSLNLLASSLSTNMSTFPSIYSNKRSMSDKDEDSCNQSLFGFKKQRIQNPDVVPKEVFHAVYLECLTERHLATKLAGFFSLQLEMISQTLLRNSLGFFVLVDDKVVQNMRDSSSFIIDATEDEEFIGLYKIILKPIEA